MPNRSRTMIVLAVVIAIGLVIALKGRQPAVTPGAQAAPSNGIIVPETDEAPATPAPETAGTAGGQSPDAEAQAPGEDQPDKQLPRFVEVGAQKCIPCKMMQPILDQLRSEYSGRLEIEFADVWQNPELGVKYNVRTIPTQVIYDAGGEEVFRHVGYWPKEDIDAKLKELGIVH